MRYSVTLREDYDQKVVFQKENVFCYSKKELDRHYPEGGYTIIGETKKKNKKKIIGQLQTRKRLMDVCEPGQHSALLYRRAGYVGVGGDNYIALLKPRWPFVLIFLGMLAILFLLLFLLKLGPGESIVLVPDHPLPEKDPNVEVIEGDDSEKADVEEGGGSVSMIYTLEAQVSLASGQVEIYFKNPNASSHDVVVELYLISGESEFLVAQSGRIEPGYALNQLELIDGAVVLSEGVYTGLYRLQCYDPESGERALVAPEITGLAVEVVNE